MAICLTAFGLADQLDAVTIALGLNASVGLLGLKRSKSICGKDAILNC